MATINARLYQRRDTEANWESVDPTVASGEICVTTDGTHPKFKIPIAGVAWTTIDYYQHDAADVYGTMSANIVPRTNTLANLEALDGTADEPLDGELCRVTNLGSFGVWDATGGTVITTLGVLTVVAATGHVPSIRAASGAAILELKRGSDGATLITVDQFGTFVGLGATFSSTLTANAFFSFGTPTELTIASGEVTATRSSHTIDTEGDASTDDLVTINGGAVGRFLLLTAANGARIPTLKHGAGNLRLSGASDRSLGADDSILIYHNGTNWLEVPSISSA